MIVFSWAFSPEQLKTLLFVPSALYSRNKNRNETCTVNKLPLTGFWVLHLFCLFCSFTGIERSAKADQYEILFYRYMPRRAFMEFEKVGQ